MFEFAAAILGNVIAARLPLTMLGCALLIVGAALIARKLMERHTP